MSITVYRDDEGAERSVRVVGDVDVASADVVARAVHEALREAAEGAGGTVVVDLAEVGFLDSSGVRALLTAREAALSAEVTLTLRNPRPAVVRVLEVTGVAPVFEL